LLLFVPLIVYILAFYILTSGNINFSEIRFTSLAFYLFLFSIISTAVLGYYNDLKEVEQRKLLAIELSSGEDPLTEYILHTACQEMKADTHLTALLSTAPYDVNMEDQAIEYIQDTYLSDRMRKYEWMITICNPQRSLIIQPDGYMVNCLAYFDDIIHTIGRPTLGDHLYRYDNEAGMSNYISNQHYVLNGGVDTITVFIELYSFFFPEEGLGYPELLIDEKIETHSGLENYSYARYKAGKLVFKFGDYPYSTNISVYLQDSTEVFFNHNNNNHYISEIKEDEYLIISKEEAGFLGIIAPFSYLLIFFAIFIIIFLTFIHFPFTRTHFDLNFRNRLQLYIISLIIVSFVMVGVITVRYVIDLNTSKNQEILREKTHSVLIELEHKLAGAQELTPDMQEYLTNLLIKFSQVFFSDINLYDLQGNLLASSRPEIFQKKLISSRMNESAFRSLTVDKKLLFIHTETIGDQDYFSAYVPFMNEDNRVMAYLNLPYFARQTELQNEISVFLNAFMNVYVLMIAVAIFIAVLISRYTTRPLQLIRDKMGTFSLKGTNEKIKWSRNDEIGTLVAEYNRMIDELSRSAELLAKSERESAWREMAKQVAHEIKNPLTPMKLSVQYLQKAWDEKTPDWDKRLKRFTQTIIEHIDTLSAIASEFSDFAKMPQKKATKIDISESIRSSLDLFSDIENIRFTYTAKPNAPHYIFADKTQIIRVFNNLIQNSVQAIGQEDDGIIDISLEARENKYIIRVRDNGPGIPEETIDKIFSPSFTTKTSGMGLGLALVRSIILEAGGEVTFESSAEKGTSFIITLPVYQD
jgi:signal transduction histidine kinase